MGSETLDKVSARRRKNLIRGYSIFFALFALCACCVFGFHILWGLHTVTSWTTPSLRPSHVGLYLCPSGKTHVDSLCAPVGLDIAHSIQDLKVIASEQFECKATEVEISNECRLFDSDGLEITEESQLSTLTNGTRIAVVKGDNHFFWPTVEIGHRWRPKHVVSPIPDKPIELETLSESPRVFLIDNFLTDDEIDYLVNHAKGRLERSHVGIGKETFHNQRTSKTAWDTGSKVSMNIQHRGYDLVRMPYVKSTSDAVQVIRYNKGQMYLLHTDYFKVGYSNLDSSKPGGTNRIITIFMYLSDVEAGGGTVFPHSTHHGKVQDDRTVSAPTDVLKQEISKENKKMAQCNIIEALQVHPKRGRAILFYNQLPDGTTDIKAEHGGCPVAEGHKWAANVWIWNRKRPRFGSSGQQVKRSGGTGSGLLSWLWGSGSKAKREEHQSEGVKIEFENQRSAEIQLYWVKPDGGEQLFGSVGPHGKIPMNTFVGHSWVARDATTQDNIQSVTVNKATSSIVIR